MRERCENEWTGKKECKTAHGKAEERATAKAHPKIRDRKLFKKVSKRYSM